MLGYLVATRSTPRWRAALADGAGRILGLGDDEPAAAESEIHELHHLEAGLDEHVLAADAAVGAAVGDVDGDVGGLADDVLGVRGRDDERAPRLGESRESRPAAASIATESWNSLPRELAMRRRRFASSLRVAITDAPPFLCPRGRGRSRHGLAERQRALAGTIQPHDGGAVGDERLDGIEPRRLSHQRQSGVRGECDLPPCRSQPLRGNQRGLGRPAQHGVDRRR